MAKNDAVQAKRLSNFAVSPPPPPPRTYRSPAVLSRNDAVVTDSSEYIDGVPGRRMSSFNGAVLTEKVGIRERSSSDEGFCCCSEVNRFRLGGEAVDLDLELENRQWW